MTVDNPTKPEQRVKGAYGNFSVTDYITLLDLITQIPVNENIIPTY